MQIQRLFNVLVLGGAALGVACGDEPVAEDNGEEEASGGGTSSSSSTDGSGGTTMGTGGDGGSSVATGGNTSAGGAGSGAASPLECSAMPNPADACGCPCCWADCPNTDAECCAGFCESGNDGQGCCGL